MDSKWAIRDIKHGKTFHFNSWKELLSWVLETESDKLDAIIETTPPITAEMRAFYQWNKEKFDDSI